MADLKTTNIYGDAYINNKVGIATNAPATRLQIGQLSPTAATEGIQFGDDTGARLYRDSAGIIKVAGGFTSTNYILAGNYLQTAGNLIYPASQTATQRLEVGNASGNAWVTGIAIAQGGNVTVYNNLTVNNAATVTNDLTVNGNTYLGNANNDTVYVNDTIRIGATDSGDASLFFGEGAVAGSDYGARWYWDSGYTFTWYTRNNGTDTALFDYVTNDLNYINWRRHFHMQNKEINYSSQVHFNAGTRFVGNDTQYLIFRSDSTGVGGIQIQDGGITTKGYVGYWDSGGGGILNNTGNWSLRYNFGNANSGGTLYGAWVVNGNISATNLSGTNTGDQTIGNGTITIAAGTGVGVGSSNTFTTNQSGATTVTISNSGVTSNVAGTGISVSGATGAVTITNSSPNATHTGDVTGATALTIANDAVTTVKILNANVTNAKLANSSLTIGSTAISLGATATTIAGLTSVTSTTFVGALTGNASTATNVAWSGITSKPTTLSGFGITDAASINGVSNQNFSANSIYPYEWIRFMVDAGIYWQSGTYAGWHIHPQATWGMSFRSNAATDCGLQLRRSDATSLGAVYADGTSIGFLTAAFGWGASFTVAGTMNRGTVPLGRIETITAYTILGNNNASAAAVPSALTPAQVATMLSGQTMNIAGSSTSCTGNAATATSADNIDGRSFVNTNSNSATNADSINSNGISYYTGGVTNFSGNATDGGLYSQAYSNDWQHQIAGDYRSGQIALRGKNSGTWQSWRRVLDDTNSPYALNMNQYVRTTDTCSFAGLTVSNTINGSVTGNAATATTATSAGCINSDTGNVGGNRLQYWQVSGNTTLNPDGEWYNAIRMGHGDPVTYYGNTLAIRMTGGNLGDIYTRTLTNGTQGSWNRFWHNNNDGAGSGLDADLVDGKGLAVAATADTIVLRDGSGHIYGAYILGSYFNASAGNSENPTIGQIWTQNTTDNYLRKSTPAHFRSQVTDGSYPSLTGANASGTWSINITGNAGTATSAVTAGSCTGNAGSADVATYARRVDGATRTSFTVGGNKDNYYPVIFNIGSGATALQYSEFVIERGGYEEPGYTFAGGNTFSTLNIRFSCKSNGWGYGASYENVEMHGYTTQLVANWQQMSEASKLIVWLRGATIYYFWNVVANTTLHDGNSGGTSLTLAQAPHYSYTYTSTQTVQTKALYGKYVNSSTGTSGIYVAGNVLAEGLFSGPGTGLTGTASSLSIGGNAATATILQTARNINGTSFNGSAAITTATWGTARTLTIGSTGKSVDGSAAVSWSLAEIGAAATNQTMFIGTTSVAINRASSAITLTGVSIDGNAATATTATNVTIANGSVTLAKIENITAYTILGNSNASAAATPAALSVATVATMLSGQTMNINGSSTSCSGNAATATLATKASTLSQGGGNGTGMTFNWSGQGGQPTWLWGSNDGTNIYVWNPSNFNVNYATSAGSATSATTAGSCSGNAASATNATTAGGLAVQSGTNYDANKIVRTDGNGYILAGWINTISGDNGTTAIDRVYASSDGYIRYYTPANFRTVLDVPTRNGSGVTNFGINTAPSNRLHINGDNANPSIRVDNGAVVLAASAASNSKTFYGWLPISIAGTTKWIQMYN